MEKIEKLIDLLERSIKDDASLLLTGGNIIKEGYNNEVDETREIIHHAKDWLSNYSSKLIETTGINTLKIKYTNISGYFIEVPPTQVHKVPDTFVLRQNLVGGSRFITEELRNFEKKLIEGESSLASKEYELFQEIREEVLNNFKDIKEVSESIAQVDMMLGLSKVAYKNNYVRPEIHTGYDIEIIGGRHPIIEQRERDFISNNLTLKEDEFVHIITGPNMGGKSTFLRQNALIILMAHIGSFVPARSAKIPLTDKILSRIGAADNLYMGQSTFMVEMQETAYILHNSTPRSFVIIDEIGRGTSTYDGMSLAWAILKHNHDIIKAKTLFATHYHELIDESSSLSGVKNFSIAVGENEENLVFLRKIIPGGMRKSFGIEVARIAGIPKEVIQESRKMLHKLEIEHGKRPNIQMSFSVPPEKIIEYIEKESELEEAFKNLDMNTMTPLEVFQFVIDMKRKIGK